MSQSELEGLVSPKSAAQIQATYTQQPKEFLVLKENWQALQLFLSCATQWRYAPMGGVTGLDYSALLAVMDMHQIPKKKRKRRLKQVQWIERGALEKLNERKK